MAAEVAAFDAVLAGLSEAEIKGGMKALRASRGDCKISLPPTAEAFGKWCAVSVPVGVVRYRAQVVSAEGRKHIEIIKGLLCG
jgi:hypothetical protein